MSMPNSPRTSLDRVLDDLGTTLLQLVHGHVRSNVEISSVVVHDPVDEIPWPPGSLVLGIGVSEVEDIVALLAECGRRQSVGLVLRSPVPTDERITDLARRAGVTVLGLTPGASWIQLGAMLQSILAYDDVVEVGDPTLGGIPSGDLFALANAIAALLDAPITIEDRNARVLAFSNRQDEADRPRVETILERQVSTLYTHYLDELGVFGRLYRSNEPMFIDAYNDGSQLIGLPRVALGIRAGDEILGSVWAVVPEPMSDERMRTFRDVGSLVALHILRRRAGADVERRLRADLIATVLEGGPGAMDAASRLGIANHPAVVLAVEVVKPTTGEPPAPADLVLQRQRVSDALTMYLAAAHRTSASALVGDIVFGIVPIVGPLAEAERRAVRLASDFLNRTGASTGAVVGIGPVSSDTTGLPASRDGALRALRVLRSAQGGRRVASIGDVGVEALLIEVADLAAGRGGVVSRSLARLLAYDAKHQSSLVGTLRAWLEALGDSSAAAGASGVHPNTFRYRLKRVTEVGGIDLADADERFSLLLQLRLMNIDPRTAVEDRLQSGDSGAPGGSAGADVGDR